MCVSPAPVESASSERRSAYFSTCSALNLEKVWAWIVTNFLVIGVLSAVLVSLLYPIPGDYLSSISLSKIYIVSFVNICVVFLISGLTLDLSRGATLHKHWLCICYGIITINFITTFISFILVRLPFSTRQFATGMVIFASVPTTLGVGISLTQAAQGDTLLATVLTVLSNIVGIGSVPLLLSLYLTDENSSVQLDPAALCLQLVLSVLLPTILGVVLQQIVPHLRAFVSWWKKELSMFSSFNLFLIVFMALSASQPVLLQQSPAEIVCVLIASILIHCICLVINYYACFKVLKIAFPQAVALTILSSQKSSPVALAIIAGITKDLKVTGLLAIPCIIGQLSQIFIGSFVAKWFSKHAGNLEADRATPGTSLVPSLPTMEHPLQMQNAENAAVAGEAHTMAADEERDVSVLV